MQAVLDFSVVKILSKIPGYFSLFGNKMLSFINAVVCRSAWSQVTHKNYLGLGIKFSLSVHLYNFYSSAFLYASATGSGP